MKASTKPTKRSKLGAAYKAVAHWVTGSPPEPSRPVAQASTPIPVTPAPRGPDALPLWTFLWGAGCRRLHLVPDGVPRPGDIVVSNLAELLRIIDDPQTPPAVMHTLALQLETGFLERWLSLGNELGAASAASEIREDPRKLKLDRWLQRVGRTSYFIGLHQIHTVADLATLPERGGNLALLWQHIQEGVPQQRFHADRASVEILEAVRTDASLPETTRPLIACLRLGLHRLPCGTRMLDKLIDLETVIMERGGREALYALLHARALETWADTLVPGMGARVAAARSLPPDIAVDRAVRSVLGPAVYPVPGARAANFAELAMQADHDLDLFCNDAAARARIRDALWGPIALPGVPANVCDAPEPQLAAINPRHQASVYSWIALNLSALRLGTRIVRSRDELLDVIASAGGRSAASECAAEGILPMWYRFALGQSLPEALSHGIPAAMFPALCVAIGEPAPAIALSWDITAASIPEDGVATFHPTIDNLDPVRAALLEVSLMQTPERGDALAESRIALAPGESRTLEVTYRGRLGLSGQIELAVAFSHTGAPASQPPVAHQRLSVMAGLPWAMVLPAMVGWTAMGAIGLLLLRGVLHLLTADPHSGQLRAATGLPGTSTLFGCVATLVALGLVRWRYYRQHGQLWPAPLSAPRRRRWAAGLFAVVVLTAWHELDSSSLLLLVGLAAIAVKLAELDTRSALVAIGGMCIAVPFGQALVDVGAGIDVATILAGRTLSSGTDVIDLAIAGWTVIGAVLGLSFGVALGLRSVRRPALAEIARFAILVVGLFVLGGLVAASRGGQ